IISIWKLCAVSHTITKSFWAPGTRDRWPDMHFFSSTRFLQMSAGVAVLAASLVSAQAAVDPAVARLGQAVDAYGKRDYFTTVHLLTAAGQPVKLRDYVAYYLANAQLVTNNGEDAVRDLARYEANPIAGSPLTGRLNL